MGLAGAALEEWQGLWPGFGAGEGVSPKTQGVAGSEVTQAVQLGCRLVPDALKTPSSQCVLSVCVMFPGRHEVNTCTPKTVAAPPHCWEVLSASRPPVQGRGLWAHVALRNPSLGSWEVLSASRPPVQGRGLWAHVALRNPSLGSWEVLS